MTRCLIVRQVVPGLKPRSFEVMAFTVLKAGAATVQRQERLCYRKSGGASAETRWEKSGFLTRQKPPGSE
jgi:hypothetical protein